MFSRLRLLIAFGELAFVFLFVTTANSQNKYGEKSQEERGTLEIITSVPRTMSFQGILKDDAGELITDTLSITFRVYDIEIGGSAIWQESVADVSIIDGNFNAVLGETTPLALGFDADYWLSLQIEGDPEETEPRLKLHMTPYSARSDTTDYALNSDLLDGLDSGDFAGAVHEHDANYVNEGQADAISSGMILDGDIQFIDFGQNGANDGQIIKWDASFGWVAADDNTGGSSGWIDDGGVVRLETAGDAVGIGTVEPTEKLDVSGNILVTGKATIGSGHTNAGTNAFVAGADNAASGNYGTVGGGQLNESSGPWITIGGGYSNAASGFFSTIGGGEHNVASLNNSTIGGGESNTASGNYSTIGGGYGNTANGSYSTVPGGWYCAAREDYSFAAGISAKSNHEGSVVISAHSWIDTISSGGAEQMVLRADGCLYVTNTGGLAPYDNTNIITTRGGAYLSGNGATWTNASDRNMKENFTPVEGGEVLRKISELPISQWNYKEDDKSISHIGPVAQDFYRIFELGDNDRSISTIDPSGIALVGIQALLDRIDELESRIAELEERTK
jgi:hypothetical protein